jgi:hypothetical protein
MNDDVSIKLSEAATNIIENLACRIAEQQGGTITPNHLMPYLPMSWDMIKSCLDEMVDDTSVLSERVDNIVRYEFTVYKCADNNGGGGLRISNCLSCGSDLAAGMTSVMCSNCFKVLKAELNRLAERTGWPAQAVYEHEILYLASHLQNPVHAEKLSGRSRYTLRRMRQKLDKMSINGTIRQELDQEAGVMTYIFPEITYSKSLFLHNMSLIRTYPSSVMEEINIKVVKIVSILGVLLLALFVLAFLHVPFPLLVMIFLIAAPIISVVVWSHKKQPTDI